MTCTSIGEDPDTAVLTAQSFHHCYNINFMVSFACTFISTSLWISSMTLCSSITYTTALHEQYNNYNSCTLCYTVVLGNITSYYEECEMYNTNHDTTYMPGYTKSKVIQGCQLVIYNASGQRTSSDICQSEWSLSFLFLTVRMTWFSNTNDCT